MKLSYNKLIIFKKNWRVKESFLLKLSNLSLSYIPTDWYHLFICPIIVSLFHFSHSFFTYLFFFLYLFVPSIISFFFQLVFNFKFLSFHISSFYTVYLYTCLYLETLSSRLIEEEFVFTLAPFECINICLLYTSPSPRD